MQEFSITSSHRSFYTGHTDTPQRETLGAVYFYHSRRSKGCENAAPSLSASLHLCVCASPLRALINAHSL